MIASSIDTSRAAPVVPETARLGLPGATHPSSAGLLEILAEQTEDLLWVKDLTSGRALYVNDAYERIWGRSRAALYEDPLDWRQGVDPEDRAGVQEAFDALFLHGVPFEITYRVRVGTAVRWARERAWKVQDSRWSVPLAVGIVSDVTRRRELESQQKLLLREMNH